MGGEGKGRERVRACVEDTGMRLLLQMERPEGVRVRWVER